MAAVIVTGTVDNAGNVTGSANVSAVIGATAGETIVRFTGKQFAKRPQVVVTPHVNKLNYAASVHTVSQDGFSVWSVDLGNTPVTIAFDFVAIQP